MIWDAMIHSLIITTTLPLMLLPTLPPTPQVVIDNGTFLINTVTSVIPFMNMLFTPILFTAIVGVVIALLVFENLYWAVIWVYKRLPFVN